MRYLLILRNILVIYLFAITTIFGFIMLFKRLETLEKILIEKRFVLSDTENKIIHVWEYEDEFYVVYAGMFHLIVFYLSVGDSFIFRTRLNRDYILKTI